MKKLFTLVTLALTAISGAWATESGSVTITWLPSTMTAITTAGTASVDNLMTVNDLTYSSDVSSFKIRSNQDSKNWGEFKFTTISNKQWNKDDYAVFSITIADGVTFTPTNATVHAGGSGSGNSSAGIFSTRQTSNGGSAIKKDGEGGADLTLNSFSATSYSGGQTLSFYIHMGANSGKGVSLCNVVLTGTYEKEEVTTYALNTTVNPAVAGSIVRSPNQESYLAGKSVTLTATPNYGYEFVNWTKGGVEQGTDATLNITTAAADEEYVANFNKLTTYALTTIANPLAGGTINRSPDHDEYLSGEAVTLTAVPAEGYYFINWTKGGVEHSTDAALNIITTAVEEEYVANFEKLYSVTYDIDDYNNTTTKALTNFDAAHNINEKYADKDGSYTIPTYSHYYMYREGYVFSKWEDQDGNQYEKGTTINGITKDIVLTPVWVATTQSLENSASETTVTWNLGKSTILFNGWQYAPQVGYYTKPHTINGELIAVPMIVNTTNGKVDNSTRSDALAQVNKGTTFTIPAIKGMTVVLTANNNISTTTVAGNTPSEGSGTRTATYNYTGENGTAVIDIMDGSYYSQIKVTYPKMVEFVSISAAGYATLYSESALAIPTGVKAYTGKISGSSLLLTEIQGGIIPASTAVVLEGAKGNYIFNPTTGGTAEANDLKGVSVNTDVLANSVLVLGLDENDVPGFYTFTGTTLAAGKAYLEMPASGAPAIYFSFEDETEVTGVYNLRVEEKANAAFDLTGRRANGKGLMIQNGKVVLVK